MPVIVSVRVFFVKIGFDLAEISSRSTSQKFLRGKNDNFGLFCIKCLFIWCSHPMSLCLLSILIDISWIDYVLKCHWRRKYMGELSNMYTSHYFCEFIYVLLFLLSVHHDQSKRVQCPLSADSPLSRETLFTPPTTVQIFKPVRCP